MRSVFSRPTEIFEGGSVIRSLGNDPVTGFAVVERWDEASGTWIDTGKPELLAEMLPGKGKRLSASEILSRGITLD